jgi:hypothetical protein
MKKKEWATAHHTTYACGTSPRAADRRCKGDPEKLGASLFMLFFSFQKRKKIANLDFL